jgi:hypothetical protein
MRLVRQGALSIVVIFAPGTVWGEEAVDGQSLHPPPVDGKTKAKGGEFRTDDGSRISYGVDLALLRISVARRADEPARLRHYETQIETLPGEFGFFVALDPSLSPWRIANSDGDDLQLMSPTAFVLFGPESTVDQSSLSLGAGMGFLDRTLMFGLAFDLYRGMPARGVDGASKATAETGLVPWALAPQGEITPENVALLGSLTLGGVINRFSGSGGD